MCWCRHIVGGQFRCNVSFATKKIAPPYSTILHHTPCLGGGIYVVSIVSTVVITVVIVIVIVIAITIVIIVTSHSLSLILTHSFTDSPTCLPFSLRTDVWCLSLYTHPSLSLHIPNISACLYIGFQSLLLGLLHHGCKLFKTGMELWNSGTLTAVWLKSRVVLYIPNIN